MPAAPDPFIEHVCELLSPLGPVLARRMFGGWGLSVDGMSIGLVADQTLYLKGNAETEAQWRAAGCAPFAYEARGKTLQMRYFAAPDDAMESPALMLPWARLALQAAVAARAPRRTRASRRV